MSESTITVTLTGGSRLVEQITAIRDAVAAALPPEWAEGALARVHYVTDSGSGLDECVVFAEWIDGEWKHANGLGRYELRNNVTRVEPIRTLPADHIAVPQPPDDWDAPTLRHEARNQRDRGNRNLAGWLESVADALEADPA